MGCFCSDEWVVGVGRVELKGKDVELWNNDELERNCERNGAKMQVVFCAVFFFHISKKNRLHAAPGAAHPLTDQKI